MGDSNMNQKSLETIDTQKILKRNNKSDTKYKYSICCIISLLATYSITHILKSSTEQFPISNSILSILVFIAIFFTIKCAIEVTNKRLFVIASVLGIFFSICLNLGTNLYKYEQTGINNIVTWSHVFFLWPMLIAVLILLLNYLPKINEMGKNEKVEKFLSKIENKKYIFFIIWGVIFIAWIPGIIAANPGVYGYDSVYQLKYYITGNFNLHHPIIHTYLLGFFIVTLGKNIFGSYETGMLLYSIFQMLFMSLTFAIIYTKYIMKRSTLFIRMCILLLFMFFPLNAIMSFSATKDVIFAGFYALVIMQFLKISENNELLKHKRVVISVIITTFFMLIFRSQGKYIFIFGMIFAFFFLRRYWKSLTIIILSVIILFSIYSGPVTKLMGGKEDTRMINEMMSVPCMQLSRTMLNNKEELNEEEIELIEKYIPNYKDYRYFSGISDNMKNSFNSKLFKEKPSEFIKLWIKVGIKCPISYIDAFARITIGLWYPDMNYRDYEAYHPYWEYRLTGEKNAERFKGYILLDRKTPQGMKWLSDIYEDLTYKNSYQSIPIVSMLFSSGFMVWCVFMYIAICIYYRKYKHLVAVSFIIGLWLTLLLGPVVLYRYIYPIAVCIPMLIVSVLDFNKKEIENNG